MNLHLYYCPGTCSFVPHVALELVKETTGQDFDGTVINLKNGEHLKPEYKAINPRGQVPDPRHINTIRIAVPVRYPVLVHIARRSHVPFSNVVVYPEFHS